MMRSQEHTVFSGDIAFKLIATCIIFLCAKSVAVGGDSISLMQFELWLLALIPPVFYVVVENVTFSLGLQRFKKSVSGLSKVGFSVWLTSLVIFFLVMSPLFVRYEMYALYESLGKEYLTYIALVSTVISVLAVLALKVLKRGFSMKKLLMICEPESELDLFALKTFQGDSKDAIKFSKT